MRKDKHDGPDQRASTKLSISIAHLFALVNVIIAKATMIGVITDISPNPGKFLERR